MTWVAGLAGVAVLAFGTWVVVDQGDPPLPPAPIEDPSTTPSVDLEPTPSDEAAPSRTCSATELAGSHDHEMAIGLPEAVAETRIEIIEAAVECDYRALGALAIAAEDFFSYSFGDQAGDPGAFWRDRERDAKRLGEETSEYMRYLVQTLQLPYCEERGPDGKHYFVWPRVHCNDRTAEDWSDLEGLYPPAHIEQMRTGDSFLGFRVGILDDGDWVYFIAGD